MVGCCWPRSKRAILGCGKTYQRGKLGLGKAGFDAQAGDLIGGLQGIIGGLCSRVGKRCSSMSSKGTVGAISGATTRADDGEPDGPASGCMRVAGHGLRSSCAVVGQPNPRCAVSISLRGSLALFAIAVQNNEATTPDGDVEKAIRAGRSSHRPPMGRAWGMPNWIPYSRSSLRRRRASGVLPR